MKFCSILLLTLFSLPIIASDSIPTSKKSQQNWGAFGGFGFSYTEAGKETIELNIQGGFVYNRWLSAGIHLNSFLTVNPLTDKYTNEDASLIGGYGGLFAMPILYSNALVHATFPVFVGYGSVSYELYDVAQSSNHIEDSNQFWVLEPGIEIELNVLRFVRVAVGGYYRYCGKVHLNYENGNEPIVPENILNRFLIGVKLRFGKF